MLVLPVPGPPDTSAIGARAAYLAPEALAEMADRPGWYDLAVVGSAPLWTDSFSDLLGAFRWSLLG